MKQPPSPTRQVKPFTGKHMTLILVAGFAVVIAVNFLMASLARSTFGGIVVENSYVASQQFNRWLDEAARERALGWKAIASRRGDGRIGLTVTGMPKEASVTAEARHPLGQMEDVPFKFVRDAGGALVSDRELPAGRWTLRIAVVAGGRTWRSEQPIS